MPHLPPGRSNSSLKLVYSLHNPLKWDRWFSVDCGPKTELVFEIYMLISNGFHEMRDVNSVAHNVDKHTANSHYFVSLQYFAKFYPRVKNSHSYDGLYTYCTHEPWFIQNIWASALFPAIELACSPEFFTFCLLGHCLFVSTRVYLWKKPHMAFWPRERYHQHFGFR